MIKNEYINKNLGELPIHRILQQLSLKELFWDFGVVNLYPSAMIDDKATYPRVETGYAYTTDMNDEIVKKFIEKNFTQGSAILKIKLFKPKNLIVQHRPVKERENNCEITRRRNGYNIDTLISVDMQEIVKTGGKVIEIFGGGFYRERFKVFPFEKVIDRFFELRQKYKDENIDVMQLLVKLIMNCLYGEQVRKDITDSYECRSQNWMMTEYDERVFDYQKINHGNYIVKMKDDAGLKDEVKRLTPCLCP